MRKYLLIFLGLAILTVIALSFHQPPMRLMPAPLAFKDGLPNAFAANANLARSTGIEIFYATNRLPVGPRTNRLYAVVPGRDLHLGIAGLTIGNRETTWDKIYEWSTSATKDQRPQIRLDALAELGTIDPENEAAMPGGLTAWVGLVNAAIDRSADPDIIIYVHGANSTVERAAGQAAQLRHFTGQNSVVLLFAWPTAENFLRYSRDVETAFGAAPQLARLVRFLALHTKARNIDILTYSAGGMVGSGGLAEVGRFASRPGAIPPRIGEVIHAAPDADTREFVDDLRDYAGTPQRVTVQANMNDSALRLSQVMNRASRAGRPDMRELSQNATRWLLEATEQYGLELVRVEPDYIPDLSTRSHAFWYVDPWISSDTLITLLFGLTAGERGLEARQTLFREGERPATYWTYPSDYPARLARLMSELRRAPLPAQPASVTEPVQPGG